MKNLMDTFRLMIVHADGFAAGFSELVGYIIGISTGLAVVSCAICLIRIMVADEPSQISAAKSDLKHVGIAWVVLNSLWVLVTALLEIADQANL